MDKEVGSIWSAPELGNAPMMILAGPFRASSEHQEYLVAPLYTGQEPGNRWTSEDVRLESAEIGGLGDYLVAIWNARPILDQDFGLQLGLGDAAAVTAVRDAYWENINEEPARKNARLGKPIRSVNESVAEFQERELRRWQALSGRVLSAAEATVETEAEVTFRVSFVGGPTFVEFEKHDWPNDLFAEQLPISWTWNVLQWEALVPAAAFWSRRQHHAGALLRIATAFYPQDAPQGEFSTWGGRVNVEMTSSQYASHLTGEADFTTVEKIA